MRYRKLGNTGLDVSVIGLGANNFGGRLDFDQTKIVLDQVIGEGINLIDTSNSYGNTLSEEYIGRALENRRESVVLATKVSTRMAEGPNQAGNSRNNYIYKWSCNSDLCNRSIYKRNRTRYSRN